ncbi:MAG: gfo/Idh/MocA family oxidoreductase, partial [SAR324 cluster bacterium]|nr:gfo/Idh/MocA family oxidoreductase [SAR324 cluster bacterium]
TEYRDIAMGWEQSFIQSTRHFLNVLKDGGEPILTARQGRQVLKFALAAEESAQKGQSIRLQEELV